MRSCPAPHGGDHGLFPYGKSGLKCRLPDRPADRARSLPVWEEWIEIFDVPIGLVASRLFPYGKSGLKYILHGGFVAIGGLFPYGKSGLKFHHAFMHKIRKSLFPYGKSGLKSRTKRGIRLCTKSLPVWEEWIEISGSMSSGKRPQGLFPYGKSGLKCFFRPFWAVTPCLFPYGKSGLKCRLPDRPADRARVSSRMGRVD